MARPRKHDGVVYQRHGQHDLVDALPGQNRSPPPGINQHDGLE